MADAKNLGLRPPGDDPLSPPRAAQPRAVGAPLPLGSGGSGARLAEPVESRVEPAERNGASSNGRARLGSGAPVATSGPSGMQRAVSAFRAALPFVQRMLPLLEGNIAGAVSNMLAPQHHAPPAPPPQPPVNLAPLQDGLVALQTQHVELRDKIAEQTSSLKRVEDQLEMVREATDRNTLEQQELLEDLKGVGQKVNRFAFIALGLLAISIVINVLLYLHIVKVLP
jgi:hypothetical protein